MSFTDGGRRATGLDPHRLVQIVVTQRTGERWRGSGYQMTRTSVLTAAHVVGDAESLLLCALPAAGGTTAAGGMRTDGAPDVTVMEAPGRVVWSDDELDIAVVEILPAAGPGGWRPGGVLPVRYASVAAPVDCEVLGFPLFKLRPDTVSRHRRTKEAIWYRDTHHARGTTTPWSNLVARELEISLDSPGPRAEPGRSPWEGMSGAVVWSGGCVIGVVTRHYDEGLHRLTASKTERWYRLPPDRFDTLQRLTGLPARPGGLVRLPPPNNPPGWTAPPERPGAADARSAAESLARAVREQWRGEEQRQRATSRYRIQVRFDCTRRNVYEHWAGIRTPLADTLVPPRELADPLPLNGRLDEIVDVYRSVPSGRLVVLGGVGAGKTVLVSRFVLGLLHQRAPGDRVPVVFQVGSWDPTRQSLKEWMRGRLLRDYPFLEAPVDDGRSQALAVLDEDLVLPVLDGFDEIGTALQGTALGELGRTDLPLMLTSRPDEYGWAALRGVLTRAAVIELEALTVPDYADYLHFASRPIRSDGERSTVWEPVLHRLNEQPRTRGAEHLAQALSSPLMVTMARTIYDGTSGRDPRDMLDETRFDSAEALEEHLLAAFVPAVYENRPGLPARRRHRWTPELAERRLGFLAAHLEGLSTEDRRYRDIAWWELGTTLPRSVRVLVIGFLAALAFGVTTGIGNIPVDLVTTAQSLSFAVVRGIIVGSLHGLAVGVAFGAAYGYMSRSGPPEPSRLSVGFSRGGGKRRAAGAPRFLIGFGLGMPAGVVLVLLDRGPVGWLGYDDGNDGGLQGAFLLPCLLGVGAWLALSVAHWAMTPVDRRSVASVSGSLATNRVNTLFHMVVWMLVMGVPAGLGAGLQGGPLWGFLAGLVFGLEAAFGGGLGYGLSFTAWGQWVALVRIWLPLRGKVPWAVTAFLEDALDRNVLRQTGAVYQFRHVRLQEHLTHAYHAHHNLGQKRDSP
ncbi:hypothetical protein GCM10018793_67430 [Streptomyces sulfonofaciens]|uniref:NACHT domain-containing protein n=1 Tax=Streptomyces sulfonofaciens TaxID=68272 RepID=A0A919GPC3_9ACTN|nr:NACHT domain-containing protein [Streptomyces sulfonofaciens]GHH88282.1 hypothetical protein GCM10018793_67430 [Streptomyces sulfonofaciens]